MTEILILSGSEAAGEKLSALCAMLPDSRVTVLPSGGAGREAASGNGFRLIVINSPLQDESGAETAEYLAENTSSGVLLILRSEQAEKLGERMEQLGVAVLEKPLSKELFFSAARLGMTMKSRLDRLLAENRALEVRMEETKLVGRAKCVLIEHLNMTEAQAHRYIEKQAMDLRISRYEVARGILSAYEF